MSDQNHFKKFAKNLEFALSRYETDDSKTLLQSQRTQIKTLIKLENQFRKELIKHSFGPTVYQNFISYICDTKRNILAARPFFRERQTIFTKTISGALKKRKHKILYKFRINYTFVLFALKCKQWAPRSKITIIAKQIEKLRAQICEQNMPLAISQARIFYAWTPKSHLTWMDLVQIHCGGLLVAVDKFVPPDTSNMTDAESLQAYRKFRAVAIGRMISDRIEQYSETVLHFYPVDRKKIYRANKIIRQFGDNVDFVKLAELVNNEGKGIEQDSQKTNPEELANLLASASCVSGDIALDETMETTLERYSGIDEDRYDSIVESSNALNVMKNFITELPELNQKILKMKGISNGETNVVTQQTSSSRTLPSENN